MAREEFREAGIAALLLALFDGYLLSRRILGEPVFQLPFEVMIFYLPMILLVAYVIYLLRLGPKS